MYVAMLLVCNGW